MTIASAVETDEELDRVEARHICPEKVLSELLKQAKADEPEGQEAKPSS
jgi:hypothetical protein